MKTRLLRLFSFIYPLAFFQIPFANAGLNKFTEIDSFDNWTIEQKFDSETKDISCRASMNGYGTWFGDKIRLNQDDDLFYPKGIPKENLRVSMPLKKLRISLKKCRSGLIYSPVLNNSEDSDLS